MIPIPLLHELFAQLMLIAVGYARIAPVFFMLPFLNGGVLTGVIRLSVIALVAARLLPLSVFELPPFDAVRYVVLIGQEAIVGLILGSLLALPFWIFHALGGLIDNQRGATISSTMDPINGVETSEMANFLNLFCAAVFLQGGGMNWVLSTLARSYTLCTPQRGCDIDFLQGLGLLDSVVSQAMVLGAPVVLALLLSEALLGLLSRFAPQMNAFSISLTIKSAIALMIMLFYFGPVLVPKGLMIAHVTQIDTWLGQKGR